MQNQNDLLNRSRTLEGLSVGEYVLKTLKGRSPEQLHRDMLKQGSSVSPSAQPHLPEWVDEWAGVGRHEQFWRLDAASAFRQMMRDAHRFMADRGVALSGTEQEALASIIMLSFAHTAANDRGSRSSVERSVGRGRAVPRSVVIAGILITLAAVLFLVLAS